LKNKSQYADSVVLINYDLVAGSTDVAVDNGGKIITFPNPLISTKPSQDIVWERQLIKGKPPDELFQIISQPFKCSTISQRGCFVPRQTIFLFKNGSTPFVNICFHCSSYKTSLDLKKISAFDICGGKNYRITL
jgi:hypothetical protein